MYAELTDEERELLLEVLEEKQKHMIQEINHTDTIEYERMLKRQLEILEGIMSKLAR